MICLCFAIKTSNYCVKLIKNKTIMGSIQRELFRPYGTLSLFGIFPAIYRWEKIIITIKSRQGRYHDLLNRYPL